MISVSHPSLPRAGGLVAGLGLAAALAGCVSTQQKAALLHIQNAWIVTAQSPTLVRAENPRVRIEAVSVVQRGRTAAVVVRLRNLSGHAVGDLPISVGVRRAARRTYLNRSTNLSYFQSHLPALPARGAITWVFTTHQRKQLSGTPFAVVGAHPVPTLRLGDGSPAIRVNLIRGGGAHVRLRVSNPSQTPQLQLQLYAVSHHAGRLTAAGNSTVSDLDAGQTTTARLTLVGRPASALQIEALPTMLVH